MITKPILLGQAALLLLLSTFNSQLSTAHAQGTAFTYQGRLNDGANPANGIYDLRFSIYETAGGGSPVGPVLTNSATGVSNGLFIVTLDFGANIFTSANRFLEIAVRSNGVAGFTTLNSRQRITPAPYAIFAENVGIGGLSAGTYGNAVTLNNASNSFSGSFNGNGANVTNVNAATLGGLSSSSFWKLGGNAGANPTNGAFLGNTDNLPLEFRVDGTRALRLEPNTNGGPNVIGGSPRNFVAPGVVGATIAGGGATVYYSFLTSGPYTNRVLKNFGSVLGGRDNTAGGHASVAMGASTTANGDYSTAMGFATTANGYCSMAAGNFTTASGDFSSVMGYFNTASANYSTAMGAQTTASGGYSTAMGYDTTASGIASIATGSGTIASGDYAIAMGRSAYAIHNGSFVWADNQTEIFNSTSTNQFSIRASAGLRLSDDTPAISFGATGRQMINLYNDTYGIGVQSSTMYFRSNSRFSWFDGGVHSDTQNSPGAGGTVLMTLNSSGLTVNGVFVSSSDRNVKAGFEAVDPQKILAKVAALPIQRWHFTNDVNTTHVGPMAQDFQAAFGVGSDEKHIATVDADGVALAAIQGLNQKLEEKLEQKETEITELKRRLEKLEQLLAPKLAVDVK